MPFVSEYGCELGHRFDYMHMGSRESLPEYVPCEGMVAKAVKPEPNFEEQKEDAPPQDSPLPALVRCSRMAERVMSAPRIKTIVRGNGDFMEREKERLTKRSEEYDASHKGKQAKMDVVERRVKAGEVT